MTDAVTLVDTSTLPAALASRGVACTPRQARAWMARLPSWPSPLNGRLVISADALDAALAEGRDEAARRWKLDEARQARGRKGRPVDAGVADAMPRQSRAAARRAQRSAKS